MPFSDAAPKTHTNCHGGAPSSVICVTSPEKIAMRCLGSACGQQGPRTTPGLVACRFSDYRAAVALIGAGLRLRGRHQFFKCCILAALQADKRAARTSYDDVLTKSLARGQHEQPDRNRGNWRGDSRHEAERCAS